MTEESTAPPISIIPDGEVITLEDGKMLACRFGNLIFTWRVTEGEIHMLEDPDPDDAERVAIPVAVLRAAKTESGALVPFEADAFREFCIYFLREAAKAPIMDSTPEETEEQRAERVKREEAKIKAMMREFASGLVDGIDQGKTIPEIMVLLAEAKGMAKELMDSLGIDGSALDPIEDVSVEIVGDAKSVLLRQHGWIALEPGSAQLIQSDSDGDGSVLLAKFGAGVRQAVADATGIGVGESDWFAMPMRNVLALHLPAEMFKSDDEEKPEPPPPALTEGMRVIVPGDRKGEVIGSPDSEGRLPVQIDGGEIEVFGPDEVKEEVPF